MRAEHVADMPRIIKILAIGLLGVLALIFTLPVVAYFHRKPAALFIHVETLPWQTITIESDNLSSSLSFQSPSRAIVSPISYGIYRIGIQLTNGQAVWSQYYHRDAGNRRRVDLFVTPSSSGFHFRQTANGKEGLFDGEARLEDATKQKPFSLSWL